MTFHLTEHRYRTKNNRLDVYRDGIVLTAVYFKLPNAIKLCFGAVMVYRLAKSEGKVAVVYVAS
jgi:hypothetical protein